MERVVIFSDGAARGNPGLAAIAYTLTLNNQPPIEFSKMISSTTNNQAEYQALVAALNRLLEFNLRAAVIECFSDSELMVKQLNGLYKVKDYGLKLHFETIRSLKQQLEKENNTIFFKHIGRNDNKKADALANLALDGQPVDR